MGFTTVPRVIRIHLRWCRFFVRPRRLQERCKVFQMFPNLHLTTQLLIEESFPIQLLEFFDT